MQLDNGGEFGVGPLFVCFLRNLKKEKKKSESRAPIEPQDFIGHILRC